MARSWRTPGPSSFLTSSVIASPVATAMVGLGVGSPGTKNAIERQTITTDRGCEHAPDAQITSVAATQTAVRRTAWRMARGGRGTGADSRESTARWSAVAPRQTADVAFVGMWHGTILVAGVLLGVSGVALAQTPTTSPPSHSSRPFEI